MLADGSRDLEALAGIAREMLSAPLESAALAAPSFGPSIVLTIDREAGDFSPASIAALFRDMMAVTQGAARPAFLARGCTNIGFYVVCDSNRESAEALEQFMSGALDEIAYVYEVSSVTLSGFHRRVKSGSIRKSDPIYIKYS